VNNSRRILPPSVGNRERRSLHECDGVLGLVEETVGGSIEPSFHHSRSGVIVTATWGSGAVAET